MHPEVDLNLEVRYIDGCLREVRNNSDNGDFLLCSDT